MRQLILAAMLLAIPAFAQTPAPTAGSGGGGPVGPSVSTPTQPTGRTPPGTPTAGTASGALARDATGQGVIGHTTNPPSAVPGNTGGPAGSGQGNVSR